MCNVRLAGHVTRASQHQPTMRPLRFVAPLITLLLISNSSSASHLCGAEIYHDHVSGLTYDLELHIYAGSTINPSTYNLEMGDGNTAILSLVQIDTFPSFCCSYRLIYTGQHTYGAAGQYPIGVELTLRSADVINIPFPTNQSICVRGIINASSPNTYNSSVRLTSPQTYVYFNGNTLIHETTPVDIDGDSLAITLGIPSGNFCNVMLGYDMPHVVSPPGDTSWVDLSTGLFQFQDPFIIGAYVILINVNEYRNGTLVGRVQRDMKFCLNGTTGLAASPTEAASSLVPGEAPGHFVLRGAAPGAPCTVHDAGGRLLDHVQAPNDGVLDFSGLPAGVYTLTVGGQDGAEVKRFVLPQ